MRKAYLFDLDGTLLASTHVWDDVGVKFLEKHHIPIPNNLNEIISDMSFAQSAAYFIKLGHLSMSVEEVAQCFYEMVKEKYDQEITTKPFVKEFLKVSHEQKVPMGVVTALGANLAYRCLKRNHIVSYFDFVLTCDDFGSGKDNTAIYLEAAKRCNALPKDTIVFEDALYCMKSAKQAGMQVIGVYDDTQSITVEEKLMYCDRFIESFEEMIKERII